MVYYLTMAITTEKLRKLIPGEEFDYQTLQDALFSYAAPRDRITALMRQGAIIRATKGLYVFGDNLRRRRLCLNFLAILIFGPTYSAPNYALQYSELILER